MRGPVETKQVLNARYYLLYHTPYQVVAGYIVGVIFGAIEFALTEWIPLLYPHSILGRLRRFEQWVWEGVGGIGGWDLGGSEGGWGEGHFIVPATVAGEQTKKKR
jgi:dolichyldiphosphatase